MSTHVEKPPATVSARITPGLFGCVAPELRRRGHTRKVARTAGAMRSAGGAARYLVVPVSANKDTHVSASPAIRSIADVRGLAVDSAFHLCARAQHAARPPRGPTSARAFEEAMGETDIPAEQSQTEEEARIPSPDAQSSRPRGDSTSSQQGPLPAFGLIWRVRGQSSFRALARGRRRRAGSLEVRTAVIGPNLEPPRVAFSVGRSVGDAVTRNRVRRRLRAAVREHARSLVPGAAYLVGADPRSANVPYTELSSTLRAILAQLSDESA
jgi:ribonuclease P protein component